MSTPRGIFETFPGQDSQAGSPPPSPFAIAPESASQNAAPASPPSAPSPFAIAPDAPKKASPFAIVNEDEDSKTVRLPDRRKPAESPFQISEPKEFGFEAARPAARAATGTSRHSDRTGETTRRSPTSPPPLPHRFPWSNLLPHPHPHQRHSLLAPLVAGHRRKPLQNPPPSQSQSRLPHPLLP